MDHRYYRVGNTELMVPMSHRLDEYQARFKLYDRALPKIARAIAEKYPDMTAIDIGANVGDSAALICATRDIPTLCIEGDPVFRTYLRQNLSRLPSCVSLVEAFIGAVSGIVSTQAVQSKDGTASVNVSTVTGRSEGETIPVIRLGELVARYPRFASPRLLKIDTDGSDFEIICSSIDVIARAKPIILFEYDPTFRKDGIKAGAAAVAALQQAGYTHFLIYDNYGNVVSLLEEKIAQEFQNITYYIMSHALTGRQIHYVDVCAFTAGDLDVAEVIFNDHFNTLDEMIRKAGWEL